MRPLGISNSIRPWFRAICNACLFMDVLGGPIPKHNCATVGVLISLHLWPCRARTKLVAIVDDDDSMRSALQGLLKAVGLPSQAFASAEEFLKSGQQHQAACLITDIRMPGISGLELQAS